MTAAQRVFDIAELLEMIICQAAPHQIHALKLVASTWRDTINTSKAVRRVRVLDTLVYSDDHSDNDQDADGQPLGAYSNVDDFPVLWTPKITCSYTSSDWVRLNPALRRVHYTHTRRSDGRTCSDVRIILPCWGFPAHRLHEHISSPPISSITLGTYNWYKDTSEWNYPIKDSIGTVHNKDGLKIEDLLEARDAMVKSQKEWHGDAEAVDLMVHAGLEIYGVGEEDDCSLEDKLLDQKYFAGPLPRRRKAFHQHGDDAFNKAERRDLRLKWHPTMDADPDVRYWYEDI